MTNQAEVDAAAAQITEDRGRLDGIVNNAGIVKGGPVEYLPPRGMAHSGGGCAPGGGGASSSK